MTRLVLDANVIVSGIPASRGTMAALIDHWRAGSYQLVTSEFILEEVRRAWSKPYWRDRLTDVQIDRAIALLLQEADVVPVIANVQGVASHSEDDFVLATALGAGATYLVTGDRELLALGDFQGIRILSPQAMLVLLSPENSEVVSE